MRLFKQCLPKAAMAFLVFAILTGIIYTAFITGIAQLFFPRMASGNIIVGNDGNKYSMSLGQSYTQDKYLWGRVQDYDFSIPYDDPSHENSDTIPNSHGKILMYSWASNRSPAGDADEEYNRGLEGEFETLKAQNVAERVARIEAANFEMAEAGTPVPIDLVTNSGSGLDPHISPYAAEYQVARIARVRGISEDEVRAIIDECTEGRLLGIFGEPTVHVLKVNLMLDGLLD